MANVGNREFKNLIKGGTVQSLSVGVYSFISDNLEFHFDFHNSKVTENNYPELTDSQINKIIDEIVEFIEDEKPDAWADSPLLPEEYYQL